MVLAQKSNLFLLLAIWSFCFRDCQGRANNFRSADGHANKAEKNQKQPMENKNPATLFGLLSEVDQASPEPKLDVTRLSETTHR